MKRSSTMSLGKQAKTLTDAQQRIVLKHLSEGRQAKRNTVMFLLSVDAALRAKEIASLEWSMLTDASGALTDEIRLQDRASKGRSGGVVFMSKRLQKAIAEYAQDEDMMGRVLKSQRCGSLSPQVVVNWFYNLYRDLGYDGCSSHSGRRTAITSWARRISAVGGSLRDVQALARHSSIAMTQRYIEVSEDACRKVVG
jgi:integrase/recombinase XerD